MSCRLSTPCSVSLSTGQSIPAIHHPFLASEMTGFPRCPSAENRYPNQKDIEDCASILSLTYNQVRMWFTKRRRKEKKENEKLAANRKSSSVSMASTSHGRTMVNKKASARYTERKTYATNRGKDAEEMRNLTHSKNYKVQKSMRIGMKHKQSAAGQWKKNSAVSVEGLLQEKSFLRPQVLFPKDYILKRIFRKDGPPLGVEFDCLPEKGFGCHAGSWLLLNSHVRIVGFFVDIRNEICLYVSCILNFYFSSVDIPTWSNLFCPILVIALYTHTIYFLFIIEKRAANDLRGC